MRNGDSKFGVHAMETRRSPELENMHANGPAVGKHLKSPCIRGEIFTGVAWTQNVVLLLGDIYYAG